jgi:hypothetical protein
MAVVKSVPGEVHRDDDGQEHHTNAYQQEQFESSWNIIVPLSLAALATGLMQIRFMER